VVAERYASQIEAMYPLTIQIEKKEVTEVQVNPERLRELLEKENILDAWLADAGIQFLFDLAREKQIDAPSMVHISDTAATIAQMESEEKPLSTAIIVGDPVRIARTLPESQVQLLRHDHIRRMRHILVTLAMMVDGLVLGYLVDKYGYVRGIHKLKVNLDEQPVSFLLGPQFRHHAAISQRCDAVVFFVPSGGRQVRVFANGQLIGRYSNGDWSPENISYVDQAVAELAERKQYQLSLVRRVLRCAFQMSEENLGAIFIIGNADAILKHSDAPETSHFALIVSDDINNLSDRELINFAKQDGATVIDIQGRFRGCMVLLRPDATTKAEIGAGKGARHSSAAKMSAEADCLAITVSQDGPVTIYDAGQRVLSL
jgi:DNA integrity scanning protein DisA with diadenylate cyclase activity